MVAPYHQLGLLQEAAEGQIARCLLYISSEAPGSILVDADLGRHLQVLFHLSIKKQDGEVLQTTRMEEDGNGVPRTAVLGKGKRLPRGWELALQGK